MLYSRMLLECEDRWRFEINQLQDKTEVCFLLDLDTIHPDFIGMKKIITESMYYAQDFTDYFLTQILTDTFVEQ